RTTLRAMATSKLGYPRSPGTVPRARCGTYRRTRPALTIFGNAPRYRVRGNVGADLPHHEVVELFDLVSRDVRLFVRVADAGVIGQKHVLSSRHCRHRAEEKLRRLVDTARGDRVDRDPVRGRVLNRLVVGVVLPRVLLRRRVSEEE